MRRKTKGVVRYEKAEEPVCRGVGPHHQSRLARDQEAGGIPDPQLHSHLSCSRPNAGTASSRRSNPSSSTDRARENGAWYRAELAANLQSLGLQSTGGPATASATSRSAVSPTPSLERWSSRIRRRAPRRQPFPPALWTGARTRRARTADAQAPADPRAPPPRRHQQRVASAGRGARPDQGARRGALQRPALTTDPNIDLPKSCSLRSPASAP